MARDPLFSDRQDILDFGVTLSFRARIATADHGPLDAVFPEDGSGPIPWPTDGLGYRLSGNGRAMVFIQQTSPIYGPSRIGFSLLNTNAITSSGVPTSTTGLVMNNKAIGAGNPGQVDTNTTDATRLNIVQLSDTELKEWHEFWITVKALASPVNGNTHEVKVYRDGLLTPETFQVVLGLQNEAGTGSFLDIGLTGGTQAGAFDLDFVAYKEGVFAPNVAGAPGDFNNDAKVNAADYVVWRNQNGNTTTALPNDNGLGVPIRQAHYDLWRANFGAGTSSGSSVESSGIPEPHSAILAFLAAIAICTWRPTTRVM
jgi:hypothetical protein